MQVSQRTSGERAPSRSSGAPKLDDGGLAVNLAHEPAQHGAGTHLNIRCDALRRKARDDGLPAHRRRHLRDQRLDGRGGRRASARRRRWRRRARRGRAVASARSSGARRSSAGFISAQWKGALTGSGTTRLAPSALARSPARPTASRAPAITTCPAPFRFAGLTTSPSRPRRASRHASATRSASRPRIAAIAPVADRHGLLHVAAAAAHDPQRIGETEGARGDVGRVLAEAVAGDKRRADAPRAQAAGSAAMLTARIAGCVFSVSVSASSGPSKHKRLSGSPSAASASANVSRQTGKASASALPMPTFCDPWPGKMNAITGEAPLSARSRARRAR